MGNHDGVAATMEVMGAQDEPRHPRTHFSEARRLRDIGEIACMREAQILYCGLPAPLQNSV